MTSVIVVFDTGVLLQAAGKKSGPSGACYRFVYDRAVQLFITHEGLAEIEDVLNRPKIRLCFPALTDASVAEFLTEIRELSTIVTEFARVFHLERDPKDEHIVNLALAVGAGYIVARDRDLLDLMEEHDLAGRELRTLAPTLRIIDPVEFLTLLQTDPAGQ